MHCRLRCTQRQSVLLLMPVVLTCCLVACSAESMKEQALELATQLKSAFVSASRIEELAKSYEAARDNQLFTVETINPVAEVNQLTNQISQMVERKTRALKVAVAKAEEVAANYRYNPNILNTSLEQYLFGSDLKDENEVLEYDRRFLQRIVKNQSAVHIPISIYRGRQDILNQLKWTEQMEKTMVDLVSNEEYIQDSVRYMYLTTDMGLMRLFPGMKWRNPEGVTNMYDARRTSWFIEGSTCPKDMLILIDTSGSMHGQNLLLTKQATKSLIGTLGENDYVAVGQYPGKAKNAEHTEGPHLLHDKEPSNPGSSNTTTCFHTFVQATKQHKKRLFSQIDSIAAKGIVNLVDAVDFAFQLFLNHSKHRNNTDDNHGAQCISILALFTDGDISSDMEKARQQIRAYKKQNEYLEKVRIFIFSVGEHRNPDEPLVELACSNRGAFTDVPAMGAVTSDVQEGYLTTLRSLVALKEAKLSIANRSGPTMLLHSHFDPNKHRTFLFFSINQIRDLGYGVLSSLTMPIYNSSGNNSFIGLVGTDFAVKDWVALVPKHKLGANGYGFALNSNGYVLFHPELKPMPSKTNPNDTWHREPAHLDMLEVEIDDKIKRRVRRQIVRSIGNPVGVNDSAPMVTIRTFIRVHDSEHVYRGNLTYTYKRIDGTPYAATLVLPPASYRYAAFGSRRLASVLQTDDGGWTVTLNDTGDGGAGVAAKFPSPYARYLVPSGTLFCSEYFRAKLSSASLLNDTEEAAATNLTLGEGFGSYDANLDEHAEKEETERLLLTPVNMSNLLYTIANTSGLCSPHWSAAVALDLALLDAFFAGFAKRPLDGDSTGGPPMRSMAASGLSGVTGAFPSVVPYRSWLEGWSSGTYQRAMLLPELLFVSVPINPSRDYNLSTVSAAEPPMTTMASTSLGVVTDNASVANWTAGSTFESIAAGPVAPEPQDVTFFKAVTLKDGFNVGVSGVTLQGRWFSETVFTSAFGFLCDPSKANNTCYVVEDAGYIVAANQNLKSIGFFLGTVDKPLMRYLVFNLTVYSSVQEFDNQGICDRDIFKGLEKQASSVRLRSLGLAMLPAAASLVLNQAAGLQGRLGQLMILPLMPMLALAYNPEDCILMGYRYYRTNLSATTAEDPKTGTDELGRQVTVAYLEGTNLILVAVSSQPGLGHPDLGRVHDTGTVDYKELRRESVRDDGPDVCVQDFRYRVRPDTCYDYDPKEDRDCGSGSSALASQRLLTLASLSAVTVVTAIWRSFT